MEHLSELICQTTGAQSVELGEEIQTLWSGYGVIQRARLTGMEPVDVVVKHIDISASRSNRRGWGGDISHQRKVRSYQVEKTFYENFSTNCDSACRVPKLVAAREKQNDAGWIIVLQDLDATGFEVRKRSCEPQAIRACLGWLANFHATFMGSDAAGLWPIGTYWHLKTRPDELNAMPEGALKQSAFQIERSLNEAKYQTLVHGDAKVANFCFSRETPDQVAAVDFQYVGRGCGMKDVAYFISSCLTDHEAAEQQEALLAHYFQQLKESLTNRETELDLLALETEWRDLYPFAWADFCRFLSGWSPGHWKLNTYNDRITQTVLKRLEEDR